MNDYELIDSSKIVKETLENAYKVLSVKRPNPLELAQSLGSLQILREFCPQFAEEIDEAMRDIMVASIKRLLDKD